MSGSFLNTDKKINWHSFDQVENMVEVLANHTYQLLQKRLENGAVTWAVSGGSTPKPLFEKMSNKPMDWGNISIALVDERWVDVNHPRSNQAFMEKAFQKNNSQSAVCVGMKTDQNDIWKAQREVEKAYQKLPSIGPCLLGMGADGHFASLFPQAEGLDIAMDLSRSEKVAAIKAIASDVTGEEVDRMTLTLKAIVESEWPHLMLKGEAKKQALLSLLENNDLPITQLVHHLSRLGRPLDVFWAP